MLTFSFRFGYHGDFCIDLWLVAKRFAYLGKGRQVVKESYAATVISDHQRKRRSKAKDCLELNEAEREPKTTTPLSIFIAGREFQGEKNPRKMV
jgi:hypothetical protein